MPTKRRYTRRRRRRQSTYRMGFERSHIDGVIQNIGTAFKVKSLLVGAPAQQETREIRGLELLFNLDWPGTPSWGSTNQLEVGFIKINSRMGIFDATNHSVDESELTALLNDTASAHAYRGALSLVHKSFQVGINYSNQPIVTLRYGSVRLQGPHSGLFVVVQGGTNTPVNLNFHGRFLSRIREIT